MKIYNTANGKAIYSNNEQITLTDKQYNVLSAKTESVNSDILNDVFSSIFERPYDYKLESSRISSETLKYIEDNFDIKFIEKNGYKGWVLYNQNEMIRFQLENEETDDFVGGSTFSNKERMVQRYNKIMVD